MVGSIGSGGMAHVLRADHPDHGEVALKVIRAARLDTSISRFRREYRALQRIEHPNVVRVYEYGDLNGHPYIAMELVEGEELHRHLQGFAQLQPSQRDARCRHILVQLCRALAAIHRSGLVHRDLKPSNILIRSDGSCKLTDFGIVKDLDPTRTTELSTTLAGTWAYAAPEQISGQPVDHRADLYALGVIVYLMLTGRRPFQADGLAGYLAAHQEHRPPPPSQLLDGVAPDLEAICLQLLEKSPKDRFQSAQEILDRLGFHTLESARHTPWTPPLVGSPEAQETLDQAITALSRGQGGLVQLVGNEGSGRTRWTSFAVERAQALDIPAFLHTFQPEEQAFEVPLRLCRRLVSTLNDPDLQQEMSQIIESWHHGGPTDGDSRYALYDIFQNVLSRFLQDQPVVVILDDIVHLPEPDAELVRYLWRRLVEEQGLPALLIVAHDPDLPSPEWLRNLPSQIAKLCPWTEADVVTLVESVLGPGRLSSLLAKRLVQETGGNPLFITQFIRSLMARGVLKRSGSGWRVTVDEEVLLSGHLEIPPDVRALLEQRVGRLDSDARTALGLLSISGAPLPTETIRRVLNKDIEQVEQVLHELEDRGLVQEILSPDRSLWTPIHRKLSDLVEEQLPPSLSRHLHHALGETLASDGRSDAEKMLRIGEHLRLGGQPVEAFRHLTQAALRLTHRSLMSQASLTVDQALSLKEEVGHLATPEAIRPHLQTLLMAQGAVLSNQGRWSEAREAFEELLSLADRENERALATDARLALAKALRREGEAQVAKHHAQEALDQARAAQDRGRVAGALHTLATLAWSSGDLTRCELLADEGLLLTDTPDLHHLHAQLHIVRAAAEATGGRIRSAARGMAEAEQLLDRLRLRVPWVLASANLAELLLWQGDVMEAWERANDASKVASDLEFALGQVISLKVRGLASAEMGATASAAEDLQRALQLARSTRVHEEVLAVATALTLHSLAHHDPTGALRHGGRGLEAFAESPQDPERHLPVLRAALAQALVQRAPDQAARLLAAVEAELPDLPGPRRLQAHLVTARAWEQARQPARALEHAEAMLNAPNISSFRTLHLQALAIASRHTAGAGQRRHLEAGQQRLAAWIQTLPPAAAHRVARSAALHPLHRELPSEA